MGKYILKRILLMIPVIIGVIILVFTLMQIAPGDPAEVILGMTATDAQKEAMRQSLGLNDPYIVQLGRYMSDLFFHFDFGSSYITGVSVTVEMMERFPKTLIFAVSSMVLSLVIGIPLGVTAAVHQNSVADYGTMGLALVGTSLPGFWFALVLILFFSGKLGWLPAYGIGGIEYWIMPIISTAFAGITTMARQMRSGMLEVIHSDYITMAKAKGVKKRSVIYKHALPNALIPVITVASMSFGTSLGGTLIAETIFSIPGVGVYIVNAVNNRDYPVVQGGVIILAVTFSIIMLLCDLLIAAIDPRVKAQITGGRKRGKKK
ncbi:ABC transporter permease [Mediterraneibacter sp. NSJ-55]|uniref:ABC transporter permease n=1 Tax=Mediterraneibacter hominis TaxID=2763054 RepID=A0A923LHT2_9FIRM|nr:ABC transporter permease [Mediterraneibacter hominis]MBC5688377.1 ABC transporter permease [Mediterraneibacter hominis]